MTVRKADPELTALREKCALRESRLKQERSERAFVWEQVQEQIARTKEANAQAEDALREGRNDLAEAQRIAHIGSWRWDTETDEVTWSDEHWAIFGLKPGEVSRIDTAFFDTFVHPDDLEGFQSVRRSTLETGLPFSADFRILGATERCGTFSRGRVPQTLVTTSWGPYKTSLIAFRRRMRFAEARKISQRPSA